MQVSDVMRLEMVVSIFMVMATNRRARSRWSLLHHSVPNEACYSHAMLGAVMNIKGLERITEG